MIRLQGFRGSLDQEVLVVYFTAHGIDFLPEVELRRTVLSENGYQHLVRTSRKMSSLTPKEGVDLHRTVGDWIGFGISPSSCAMWI